jgi:crotonobetainyl-CoA:carnitine CoA-transferase CaiB-like acyl-CoA transferase
VPEDAPLVGIRVLDLTRILAGPWATQLLADFGAEVIKVERPGVGDDSRGWGPPYVGEEQAMSAYFLSANRGKRAMTIDLGQEAGRDMLRRLASVSDVLIENFKVGALDGMGLGYTAFSQVNPRLVFCSITGFGQTGPHRDRPGYDLLVQAMGGLMSLTGEPDGEPMKVGIALTDILTGLYAANAIQAALIERASSGSGQYIDLALLDVQIATLANQAANYLVTGKSPARRGNAHPNIVPYQAFAVRDGHVVIAVGNDAQFARFVAVLGMPQLAQDPRFSTNSARVASRDALLAILSASLAERPASDLLSALEAAQVPAGPINDLDAVFSDSHVTARGMLVSTRVAGVPVRLLANPVRFSRTPVVYHRPPPALGAHTTEVLRQLLRSSDSELERLRHDACV